MTLIATTVTCTVGVVVAAYLIDGIDDGATVERPASRVSPPTTTVPVTGGVFPTAESAGVPNGVSLRSWPWAFRTSAASGVPTETHDGMTCQVFTGYDVVLPGSEQMVVDSPCVIFRRSRFRASGDVGRVVVQRSSNQYLEIDQSDIDGGPYFARGVQGDHADIVVNASQFQRTGEAAIEMNDRSHSATLTVTNNYIYQGPGWIPGQHVDGVQMAAGGGLTVINNTILIEPFGGSTSDYSYISNSTIGVGTTLGDIGDVWIEHNLLAGGGRLMYLQSKGYDWTGVVVVKDNVFDQRYSPTGAIWGPIYPSGIPDQIDWFGNHWSSGDEVTFEDALAASP